MQVNCGSVGSAEGSCCSCPTCLVCCLPSHLPFLRLTWCLQRSGSSRAFASLASSSSQQSSVNHFCPVWLHILPHVSHYTERTSETQANKHSLYSSEIRPVFKLCLCYVILSVRLVWIYAGVEWVDIEHRKMVGVIDSLSWTFGNIAFAAIAYFVTDWKRLIVCVSSPLILCIITWW